MPYVLDRDRRDGAVSAFYLALFSARRPAEAGALMDQPTVIVGTQRSGTTLLRLDTNDACAGTG